MTKKMVSLLLFDDVEVLDFAGPFEVFSVTNELDDYMLFDVKTVSRTGGNIVARNGLSVNPSCSISEIKSTDILIVPGGAGTRPLLKQYDVIDWIRNIAENAELILSVCTGALLLAKAQLLTGLRATTHHQALDELEALAPDAEIVRAARFVDSGKVITSAGISAGIDMSLYVIEKLYGKEKVDRTADYMEFRM